ncbi:MAG: Ig-like domain-containing protein [Planctomycetes bacterium]|nr:Ig-like domain-containing protein [Planctomycetota bacterium]
MPESPPAATWKVVAWNDLGMHCMDADYSVFSILPPYNTLQCQVIDTNGKLVADATGLTVTYEAVPDPQGSINRSSQGKTNYWAFTKTLYGGSPTPDTGLAGQNMPGPTNTPQPLKFDATSKVFTAEGIPLTPYDDAGHKRTYPMMRVSVRSGAQLLATTDVVLPVSDEMDCSACHKSGAPTTAEPNEGWAYDRNHERDYRINILRLHDNFQILNPTYLAALKTAGYSDKGLYDTVATRGQPILCAKCHASNALPGTGIAGIKPLTEAIHAFHAGVKDPVTGKTLGSETNRAACYRCHPGSETRCLRGAMGGAVATDGSLAMSCQQCHGNMADVGAANRVGWLAQPSCQQCHTGTAVANNGEIRYTTVLDASGKPRQAVNQTFATNQNVPSQGFDLYRFSVGHGGLRCEACHGSTHAVYPSIHGNDNVQSRNLQGHVGTLVQCDACHRSMPEVRLDGPHGMHPVGADWVDWHGDAAKALGAAACRACHGLDYRGTVLSQSHSDQTLSTKFGAKTFFRGARISCYACHNGPSSERANPNRPAVAQDATGATTDQPVVIQLQATDPDSNPLTLRIVGQPQAGRVALSGTTATYYPDPGFAGIDSFTFAAWDGAIDSNLATVRVTRRATSSNYGDGYPGTKGVVPSLTATAPTLGTTVQMTIGNSSGASTGAMLLASLERASLISMLGGRILTELDLQVVLQLPATGTTIGSAIPDNASLIGAGVFAQVIQVDAGARHGVSFSRGLELRLGR